MPGARDLAKAISTQMPRPVRNPHYILAVFALILAACQTPAFIAATTTPRATADVFPNPANIATVYPLGASTVQPADNFGFTFEYTMCYLEVFDTLTSTFRRDVHTDPSIVVPAALTEEQMRAVYAKVMEIDFFSYPAQYQVTVPENGIFAQVTPAYRYHLTVRNADREHSVAWEDNIIDPNPLESSRLRELFHLIFGLVKTQPDVAKLPPSKVLCL